jgi:hypothetical protein
MTVNPDVSPHMADAPPPPPPSHHDLSFRQMSTQEAWAAQQLDKLATTETDLSATLKHAS